METSTIAIVLFSALVNFCIWTISVYIVFIRLKTPVYHIFAIYQLYFLFGYILRPIELTYNGSSQTWTYVGITPSDSTLLWSAFLIPLSHTIMLVGFMSANIKRKVVGPIPASVFAPRSPKLFFVTIAIFLALGAYSSSVQIGSLSNLNNVLGVAVDVDAMGGQRLLDISGYQTLFDEWVPISLITLFMFKRTRKLSVILVLAFIVYRSFAGAGRQKFVFVGIGLAIVQLIEQHRRFPTLRICVAGAAILMLFNLVGADRLAFRKAAQGDISISEIFSNANTNGSDTSITASMAEYDTFTVFAESIPSRTGYSYGTQYLRLLIWPIPRAIWSEKPIYTTNFNIIEYGNYAFLTTTLFIETYMNFGALGLGVLLFIISYSLSRFYNFIARNPSAPKILLYLTITLSTPLLFRDGIVSAAYPILVTLPALLILVANTHTWRPSDAPSLLELRGAFSLKNLQ